MPVGRVGKDPSKVTLERAVLLPNAALPRVVRLAGSVMLVRAVSRNALFPIVVRVLGNVMLLMVLVDQNADALMATTFAPAGDVIGSSKLSGLEGPGLPLGPAMDTLLPDRLADSCQAGAPVWTSLPEEYVQSALAEPAAKISAVARNALKTRLIIEVMFFIMFIYFPKV